MTPYGPFFAGPEGQLFHDADLTLCVQADFASPAATRNGVPDQWRTCRDDAVECLTALLREGDKRTEIPLPEALGGPGALHLDPRTRELRVSIEGRWRHLPEESLPRPFLRVPVGKAELRDAIREAAVWALRLRASCDLCEQIAIECRVRRPDPEEFLRAARELGVPDFIEDMTPRDCTRLLEWLREQPGPTTRRQQHARDVCSRERGGQP